MSVLDDLNSVLSREQHLTTVGGLAATVEMDALRVIAAALDVRPAFGPGTTGKAYFNATEGLWYVPMRTVREDGSQLVVPEELSKGIEPCRVQLADDQLWITRLEA